MAGDNQYPEAYTGDWAGCFSTFDEAKSKVSFVEHKRKILFGVLKGKKEITHSSYQINGKNFDWYDIIDLQDWIK